MYELSAKNDRLRKADEKDSREGSLEQGDTEISRIPGMAVRESQAHNTGAERRAHSPHAVEPAHVPAFVVKGNVIV